MGIHKKGDQAKRKAKYAKQFDITAKNKARRVEKVRAEEQKRQARLKGAE